MNYAAAAIAIDSAALMTQLRGDLGAEFVLDAMDKRVFFSTDIAAEGQVVQYVIQPGSPAELSLAVGHCTQAGATVVPRGGGFSYTGGYTPTTVDTVMVDMRRMDSIVEINTEDMYVTVECGCTWKKLYDALKAKGYRTPYFGPMSGFWATVGGALSQGSFFLGSTEHGVVAESVLSMDIVLADGTLISTGSAGGAGVSPFYRWYGPDLTGLFLSDNGALGFKTSVTLRLIRWPEHQRFGTFAFDQMPDALRLVSEVGRERLAAECYCWDPTFVKSVGQNSGRVQDLKYMAGVVGSGSSLMQGLKDAARMAIAGKRIFNGSTYLVHVSIDEMSDAAAEEKLKRVQALAAKCGGGEVEASAPRATRAIPFVDFKNSGVAETGIRNLPTNALCPHSGAQALAKAVQGFFDERRARLEADGLTYGVIAFAVGANAICIEPLIFWNDQRHKLHDRVKESSDLAKLAAFGGPTPASLSALEIRKELVQLFTSLGCVHVQIGKSYPYQSTRAAGTLSVITAIKAALDPRRLMNPGALGL